MTGVKNIMRFAAYLAAALVLPAPLSACDDVLMAVIYGRDKVSEFDQKTEKVSGALRRITERARLGAWQDASNAYGELMNEWVGIYRQFLAEPPPGLSTHPDWPGLLKSFSAEIQDLGGLVDRKEHEPVHEKVRRMQATLISTYFQGGSPEGRIAALRTTLEPLEKAKAELAKPGVTRTTLQLHLATMRTRLETLMRATPSMEAEGNTLLKGLQDAHGKLTGDAIPQDFASTLDELARSAESFRELFTRRVGAPTPQKP